VKLLKKIFVFSAILAALYFISYEKQPQFFAAQNEKQDSFFGDEGLHSIPFIQPQADHNIVSNSKGGNTVFIKWFQEYLNLIPDFTLLKSASRFVSQDTNRCEKVSLLLFPFHFFW